MRLLKSCLFCSRLTGDMCGLLSILYAVVVMVAGLGISVAEVYVSKPIPGLFEVRVIIRCNRR